LVTEIVGYDRGLEFPPNFEISSLWNRERHRVAAGIRRSSRSRKWATRGNPSRRQLCKRHFILRAASHVPDSDWFHRL